jgi:outer membrane lipoprotein-sorting protein
MSTPWLTFIVSAALLPALTHQEPMAPTPRPAVEAAAPVAEAAPPTAEALLQAMDERLNYDTRTSRATMTVDDGRRKRKYRMLSYGQGQDDVAVEYLAPAREKGTKMLKQGDNLWLYMPRAERVQKISGHMLRQGMMGSDISYEDLMASSDLRRMYAARVTGEETLDGRPCWKIEADAKDRSVSYPRRVIWVDKEHLVPTRQDLYALSGMLLKTWTMTDVKLIDGKPVPMRMELRDQLRQGSSTRMILEHVEFGVTLREEVFSRRWLERR